MTLIDAAKLALEALEQYAPQHGHPDDMSDAITAIRTAIAEAEKQEPVAWMYEDDYQRQGEEHMNRDDIIRMALDADVSIRSNWDEIALKRFADIVLANERKECVRICCEHWLNGGNAMECADAIRSRGQDPMPLFDDWGKKW